MGCLIKKYSRDWQRACSTKSRLDSHLHLSPLTVCPYFGPLPRWC